MINRLKRDPHFRYVPFVNRIVDERLKNIDIKGETFAKYKIRFSKEVKDAVSKEWSMAHIACLSRRNDSILMWSHYADSHREICIEFDEPDKAVFRNVKYSHQKPYIDLKTAYSLAIGVNFLGSSFQSGISKQWSSILNPFYVKSKEWSYQEEARGVFFLSYDNDQIVSDGKNYFYKMLHIKTIYIGCAVNQSEDLDRLIASANLRQIPVVYMKKSESEYRVIPDYDKKAPNISLNYEKEITLCRILNDIELSLSAEAYLSAFNLALVVPSICGAVEYPKVANTKEKYIQWFNKYITCNDANNDGAYLNGEVCYGIKNQFGDFGNIETCGDYGKFKLLNIKLTEWLDSGGDAYGEDEISIDVIGICELMVSEGRRFYEKNKEQIDVLPQVDFIDMDLLSERMENSSIINDRIHGKKWKSS